MQLLVLSIFALVTIQTCVHGRSAFPKIFAKSASETEELRGQIISAIHSECEHIQNERGMGSSMILYKESVNVFDRQFDVNGAAQCKFGPLLKKTDQLVYKFKRQLSVGEAARYKKFGIASAYLFIRDAEVGDAIVEITKTTFYSSDSHQPTISVTFELVSPIKSVSFSCPPNTFCCGLLCCPQPTQNFFSLQQSDVDEDERSTEDDYQPEYATEDLDQPEKSTEDADQSEKSTEDDDQPEYATEDADQSEKSTEDANQSKKSTEDADQSEKSTEDADQSEKSTEYDDQPEYATEDADQSEKSTEDANQSEKSTEDADQSEKSTEDDEQLENATGDLAQPEKSTEDADQSEKSTDDDDQPEKSTEDDDQPEKSTEDDDQPEKSTEDDDQPEKSTEDDDQPEKSTEDDDQPEKSTEDDDQPEKSTEDDLQPEKSTDDELQPEKSQKEILNPSNIYNQQNNQLRSAYPPATKMLGMLVLMLIVALCAFVRCYWQPRQKAKIAFQYTKIDNV